MENKRYPSSDLDKPETILDLLGSFWATTYQGNELLLSMSAAVGRETQQTYRQLLELLSSISRFTVPIFSTDSWYAVTFTAAELAASSSVVPTYSRNTGHVYSESDLTYDQAVLQAVYRLPVPENLVNVRLLCNRITDPSVALVQGIDFTVDHGSLLLLADPFLNPLIPTVEILDEAGNVIDKQMTLWLYRGEWDLQTVYRQFGYALKLHMRSSEGYKQVVNAILDAFVAGTNQRTQQSLIAAVFGVPLVREATEIVEYIASDYRNLNVITDRNTYAYPLTATATVEVGDIVTAGQCLTDTLEFHEFNRGQAVPQSVVPSLSLDQSLIGKKLWGDLTFQNKDLPTTVTTADDGYTEIRWDVGGFPGDVEAFWQQVHANGVASDRTLAMCLDNRTTPDGQPGALSLPATINPIQFLFDNLLRSNVVVVKLRVDSARSRQLEFIPTEHIRKIQPPHSIMLFLVELAYSDPSVIMAGPGTSQSPGYVESVGNFVCSVIEETVSPDTFVVERVKCFGISGRCT